MSVTSFLCFNINFEHVLPLFLVFLLLTLDKYIFARVFQGNQTFYRTILKFQGVPTTLIDIL